LSRNGADGARLDGAFIEGTWTRDPAFSGAQNPEHFREPSIELFERFQAASRGIVRYAMIAPEWGESATRLIRHLHERGVLVGTGHTNCTADQYREAVRHGLRAAVHLTNGPTGGSFKPFAGGGALEAALTLPDVYAEQIVDGYHVNPAYVLDIIKRKGPDRVCLVTDAMFAAAAEGIADFEVAGIRGQLSPNGKYLSVVGKRNTMFGSVLTMDVGFQNVLNWLTADSPGIWNAVHPAMRFEDALPRVSGFASANPARALRLYDAHDGPAGRPRGQCIGSLEPGKRADVVVARIAGEQGRYEVALRHVFVGGRETVRA
jgi:N-acetylglucosamine-6-phosphate deacetylase